MLKPIGPEGPLSSLLSSLSSLLSPLYFYITCMYVSNQDIPYFCFLLSLSSAYRTD